MQNIKKNWFSDTISKNYTARKVQGVYNAFKCFEKLLKKSILFRLPVSTSLLIEVVQTFYSHITLFRMSTIYTYDIGKSRIHVYSKFCECFRTDTFYCLPGLHLVLGWMHVSQQWYGHQTSCRRMGSTGPLCCYRTLAQLKKDGDIVQQAHNHENDPYVFSGPTVTS